MKNKGENMNKIIRWELISSKWDGKRKVIDCKINSKIADRIWKIVQQERRGESIQREERVEIGKIIEYLRSSLYKHVGLEDGIFGLEHTTFWKIIDCVSVKQMGQYQYSEKV